MTATDLVYYNAVGTRGGVIDLASPITTGQLNNLIPNINALEAEGGATKYRKFFVKNTHATDTALSLSHVMTRFSDADDFMNIFLGTDSDELGDIIESLGTGNDVLVTFGATLSTTPILPYSVEIVADTIVGVDDGNGIISGTGISSGTIDYATGVISVTYDVAPATAVDISTSYRDTLDKMYGISKADDELDRATYLVTVSVEGGQVLSDLYADGDIIHFIDSSTGQKIIKATIAVGGVGVSTLKIVEDIPVGIILIGSYISNTIYIGDLSAGEVTAIWVKQTIPPFCQAYTNSYFGASSIFASS